MDAPIAPTPVYVAALRSVAREGLGGGTNAAVVDDGGMITASRTVTLVSILGRKRAGGADDETLRDYAIELNANRVDPPLDDEEVDRIISNVCRYPVPDAGPEVLIGGKPLTTSEVPKPPVDWRNLFHTKKETENTPDPEFLLEGFLRVESVTGIIGPARARKSIVVLNLIHALLTGEPLFGHFAVTTRPQRVIYLCPESGLKSLAKRIRDMRLTKFVEESQFYTSMNSDLMNLTDPALLEATRGSVVFIDTAIRFFKGNENDSQDMKVLGEQCHALIRNGAQAVVLLHNTAKNAEKISLESGRGSGDFGGFLTCCWGTTLEDYDRAYHSLSHMTCVKQRDFQADRFNLEPSANPDDFFLSYVSGSENAILPPKTRFKADKDGRDAEAIAIIRAHPKKSLRELVALLLSQGIKRGKDWVQKHRSGNGVQVLDSGLTPAQL